MSGYGYADDSVTDGGSVRHGLNQGVKLIKFEFNPNGGAKGTPQDCLDIVFDIGGKEFSYRQFPITKVKDFDSGREITDPNHDLMKKAFANFNAIMTHILGCYTDRGTIKETLSEVNNFRDFCDKAASLLPEDFAEVELDIFLNYQWKIKGDNTRTFLELPKNMKWGRWICPTVPGNFEQKSLGGKSFTYTTITKDPMQYTDHENVKCVQLPSEEGQTVPVFEVTHSFARSHKYGDSAFNKMQSTESTNETTDTSPASKESINW